MKNSGIYPMIPLWCVIEDISTHNTLKKRRKYVDEGYV